MSLDEADRGILLKLAKEAIAYGLEHPDRRNYPIDTNLYRDPLRTTRASFVTLLIDNNLRGCIGTLEASRPLAADIVHNAQAAAFSDPRFDPLKQKEFDQLDIHISILSESEPMEFQSENDVIQQLIPGIDGIILEDQGHRGTFLPSVWEALPDPKQFLHHLKMKANLPGDHWSDTIKIFRYTTESF